MIETLNAYREVPDNRVAFWKDEHGVGWGITCWYGECQYTFLHKNYYPELILDGRYTNEADYRGHFDGPAQLSDFE